MTALAVKAARQIERAHCKQHRGNIYIACEDYDFTWSETEVEAFRRMWAEGTPLDRIAVALRRHVNEVAILVIDQAEQGLIKKRPGGVFGSK